MTAESRVRGWPVAAMQCAVGAALLVRPAAIARQAGGRHHPAPPRWLVRMLGTRSLLQGVATAIAPDPPVLVAGAAVDATHALSMIPVALASTRYRRVAAVSGAAALASAAVGAVAAGRIVSAGPGGRRCR